MNNQRLKIGRIKYINVLPIYYALEKGIIPNNFEFVYGTPSELNQMASSGLLDISSTSSIEYAKNFSKYYLVPDICIGSNGAVKSVLLMSRVPISDLHGRELIVSAQTHTSFALLKIILEKRYEVRPIYKVGSVEKKLSENPLPYAFLAIGDEALKFRKHPLFTYTLDLGEAWQKWTGFPFVFGVWVVNKKSLKNKPDMIREGCSKLLQSKIWGCKRLEFFCEKARRFSSLDNQELSSYFNHLCYDLGEQEKRGLIFYYELLFNYKEISHIPVLEFISLFNFMG